MLAKKITLISLLSLSISACSIFPPIQNQNNSNYELKNIPHVSIKKPHAITLLVTTPESSAVYNTNQIAYTMKPYQISYYAKNSWVDTPPNMIQQLLIQTLQNTHFYHAVTSQPNIGHHDYVLNTQLIQLQQDFTVTPIVERFGMRIQLIRVADNHIIAAKQFLMVEPTPENNAYGAVVAANRVVSLGLKEIADFLGLIEQ